MADEPLLTAVIVGSTREGRAGGALADWFAALAAGRPEIDPRLVDLAGYDFPARLPGAPTPEISRFTAEIDRADAFVIVTPEYNRSYPGPLKQAIDYAYDEWRAKAVGFVSYGSGSDGGHAVDHLRAVFTELHAMTVRRRVGHDLLAGAPGEAAEHAAGTLLDQLAWWGRALRDARRARPYVH